MSALQHRGLARHRHPQTQSQLIPTLCSPHLKTGNNKSFPEFHAPFHLLSYLSLPLLFFKSSLRTFFHCFLKREEGRERNINVRETLIGCLLHTPRPGITHTLTGNRTCNPSATGQRSNQQSHASQGSPLLFSSMSYDFQGLTASLTYLPFTPGPLVLTSSGGPVPGGL